MHIQYYYSVLLVCWSWKPCVERKGIFGHSCFCCYKGVFFIIKCTQPINKMSFMWTHYFWCFQPFKHLQSSVSCSELDSNVFGCYLPTVSMIQAEDCKFVATHSCYVPLGKKWNDSKSRLNGCLCTQCILCKYTLGSVRFVYSWLIRMMKTWHWFGQPNH